MKIKWNGYASFALTAVGRTVLITDPIDGLIICFCGNLEH